MASVPALLLGLSMLPSAWAAETLDVPLCFEPGTTPEQVAQAYADATARHLIRAPRPATQVIDRILATAANPGGSPIGHGLTISWSYVPDGLTLPPSSAVSGEAPSTLFATLNSQFPGGFAQWHPIFVEAFDAWSKVTGNRYVYEPNDNGAPFKTSGGVAGLRGDIRIAMRQIPSSVLAYNYYPADGFDMVLDSTVSWTDVASFKNVISHEHGHGLGLAHVCPADETKLMEPYASTFLTSARLDDIIGAQRLYGDAGQADTAALANDARRMRAVQFGTEPGGVPDWFLIRGIGVIEFTATPNTGVYLEGPQNGDGSCTAGASFNPAAQSNLKLTAYAANATTLLGTSDSSGTGVAERIRFRVPAGAHSAYVRVESAGAAYQPYRIKAESVTTTAILGALPAPDSIFTNGFEV